MNYKVVPFNAGITKGEGPEKAAKQLESLINSNASQGWLYQGLETIETVMTTPAVPGNNGCVGLGATPGVPERRNSIEVYVAVFSHE